MGSNGPSVTQGVVVVVTFRNIERRRGDRRNGGEEEWRGEGEEERGGGEEGERGR